MLHISARARRLLDVLLGVGVVSSLFTAVTVAWKLTLLQGLVSGTATLGALACWVLWRRGGGSRWVVSLAVAGAIATVTSDGAGALPLLFVCLAVLMVERGARAAVVLVASSALGSAVLMAMVHARSPLAVLAQTTGVVLILGYALLVGQLLRETDLARRHNERLLAQQRAAAEVEKDHVLAQERTRSAGALHDGLGHQLTAMRLSLDVAERLRRTDPDMAWAEVARAGDLATMGLDRMRTWVRALDPVSVGALTDVAALEAVADSFRGTGLDVEVVTIGESSPLDRTRGLFCLRVVQEGLTNALRHGGAGQVRIDVDRTPASLRLTLTDDGEPPDDGQQPQPSYGLRTLHGRAEELGGSVCAGWTGDGFRLIAEVPMDVPGDHQDEVRA